MEAPTHGLLIQKGFYWANLKDFKIQFVEGFCWLHVLNLVPRFRFSFDQHQEHGLWPLPTYAQSQVLFCNR